MKLLKAVFGFYLNSSIHVALAAVALTWITLLELDISYDKNCLLFVGFGTVTGYNFVKYFGLAKFHHRKLANWLKAIQLFSLVAFLVLCYYGFQLNRSALWLIIVTGSITFFYAIPFLPKHFLFDKQKNLRQISGVKVYIIALVWALVTVLLPVVNTDNIIDSDVLIICFQRFCYVLVLMLPFEIRDLNYDSLKLATIPQKIGIKKTKVIAVLLLILFFFLQFFKNELHPKHIITSFILSVVTLLFVLFSNKKQSKYYSAFWVEALPILWLILIMIL